jgi:hypothetical protein
MTVKSLILFLKSTSLMINSVFNDMGFSSIGSFLKESLFFSPKYMNLYIFSFSISGIFTFLSESTTMHFTLLNEYISINVYNPSKAIKLLFAITLVDIWTGTTKSMSDSLVTGAKEKQMVQGNKLVRSFLRFSIQVFFVGFLFNLSNLYSSLNVEWVVHSLMIAFIVGTFISAWNNAYLLGWLDKEVHGFILSIFDLKKIFNRVNRKKQEENDRDINENKKE